MKSLLTALFAMSLVPSAVAAPSMVGVYEISVHLGDREIRNLLVLDSDEGGNAQGPSHDLRGALTGSLTVPGVFSVPLANARRFTPWCHPIDRCARFSALSVGSGGNVPTTFTVRFEGEAESAYLSGQGRMLQGDRSEPIPFTIRRLDGDLSRSPPER